MEPSTRPLPVDRLTELVIHLTGAHDDTARDAVSDAVDRHGDWGDGLLNIADALVTLRRTPRTGAQEPAGVTT
jgi:hypothetical protein